MPINILPALKKNKTNKTFMVLSALGILFVLDDHAGSKIGVLTNIFPYNSFYMPMFVFISGYFFKEGNIKQTGTFILKKIKTLLIPWLLYNFFYLAVSIIIVYFFKLNWQLQIDKLLKHTWLFGTPVDICNPGWFVIMLFEVCCIYIIVRRLLGKIWNDYIALLILALIGMISVYFCHRGGIP